MSIYMVMKNGAVQKNGRKRGRKNSKAKRKKKNVQDIENEKRKRYTGQRETEVHE